MFLSVYGCVHINAGTHRDQKMASDPLDGWELADVGAGNLTLVLWKISKASPLLSHLSCPLPTTFF